MSADFVSADGSPLAMYLAIPAGEEPTIVHEAIPRGSTILELGSGPGRVTRVLVAYGHQVTAVDDSEEMLAHVTGARTVCADLHRLDLGERFDAVLGASHLINQPDPSARRAVLEVCRRHVAATGLVLLERHPPGWAETMSDTGGRAGPVEVELEAGALVDGVRAAAVTYRLGDRSWRQDFSVVDVDDEMLQEEAASAGLIFDRVLDDAATWVALRPAG